MLNQQLKIFNLKGERYINIQLGGKNEWVVSIPPLEDLQLPAQHYAVPVVKNK